jgi:hypothetical protein
VTISNLDSLSSSETRVNSGIRSCKSNHQPNEHVVSKPCEESIITQIRSEELIYSTNYSRIYNFKPRLRDLPMNILAERFIFWGLIIGVF